MSPLIIEPKVLQILDYVPVWLFEAVINLDSYTKRDVPIILRNEADSAGFVHHAEKSREYEGSSLQTDVAGSQI